MPATASSSSVPSQSQQQPQQRPNCSKSAAVPQHGSGSHHHNHHPTHLTHRQERDASKAEQLRKMGIEYGVANVNAGCNGNSINLAAAYALQQTLLRQSVPTTQLQPFQQLPIVPRPPIPSLLSLGVTNPNAPPAEATAAPKPAGTLPILPMPLPIPLAALINAAAAAPAAASSAPGSLGSLTNFTTPSILASARYTEQMQKRKLLWGNKKTPAASSAATDPATTAAAVAPTAAAAAAAAPLTNNKWEETRFSQDTDGKVATKFLRLMGMKDATPKPSEVAAGAAPGSSTAPDAISKQSELFSTMEAQYEVARQVTHTMRGMGLGFGTQPRQF